MKENKISSAGKKRTVLVVAALVVLAAAAIGLAVAYGRLRNLWLEQCVITDFASQVTITNGKMARADTIADGFGLRNGANLALIDFDTRRRELLRQIPNIRNIRITRHLPDRVDIAVEERVPTVRLDLSGRHDNADRVADTDGMVFVFHTNDPTLPVIREAAGSATTKGHLLTGHALAALRLLETCRDQFSELAVIEADVAKPDFVSIVLGKSYDRAKIAWEGMNDPSPAMMPALTAQLKHLSAAIRSKIDDSIRVWDVTQPNRVFGNTQKPIL